MSEAANAPSLVDRLRTALGRADALASATADMISESTTDDRVGRIRIGHLAEMCAEHCEAAVSALQALIAECERGAGRPEPSPPPAAGVGAP